MVLAPLPHEEAQLFYAETGAVTPALALAYFELLSAAERERHARFVVPGPALEFLLGRALLRVLLGASLGIEPQRVALRLGAQGKPELDEDGSSIAFSVSHSHGLVACLLARDCDVGVDVEDATREVEESSLAKRFFHEQEAADILALADSARRFRFFQYWTLKEACLKALGTGLSEPLDRFRFTLDADGTPSLLAGRDKPSEWQLAQLRLDEQSLLALAIKDRAPRRTPRRIVVRRFVPLESPPR